MAALAERIARTALLLAVEIRTLRVSFLQESRDSRCKTAATESPDTFVLRVPPLLYERVIRRGFEKPV